MGNGRDNQVKQIEASEQEKRIQKRIDELTAKFATMPVSETSLKEIISEAMREGFDLVPSQKIIDICEAFRSGNTDAFLEVEHTNNRVGSNEWKAYTYAYSRTKENMEAMKLIQKDFQEKR